MSKLEELIRQHCPDGVEWKKLGEISTITRGGNFQKKDFTEEGFPCIHYGQIYTHYGAHTNSTISFVSQEVAQQSKKAKPNDIIMAITSENFEDVGKSVAWLGTEDIAVSGHTAIIHHNQNAKFISYFLSSDNFFSQKNKIAHGTKVIELSPKGLSEISIPIPPLPVQEEIVRILDNFSSYAAELQAELQARRSQYDYYRNHLLAFEGRTDIQWKKLGEVADLLTGYPFDSSQFANSGIKLMRGVNIKRGNLQFDNQNDRYWNTSIGLEKFLLEPMDIVISMDGSLVGKSFGVVSKEQLPLLLVQRVTRIRSTKANIKFLFYCISNWFSDYVEKRKTEGAIPHISLKDIAAFPIPIPPLAEQQRIVDILDRFDTLCNDLTSGLPAEIEMRRKQYEYYRDRLLSF